MNATILNNLKENRDKVTKSYNKMIEMANKLNNKVIASEKFFFTVVFNHFDNMSKVMENKCLKDIYVFYREFYKAIERAEYACAKPAREENKQYFK